MLGSRVCGVLTQLALSEVFLLGLDFDMLGIVVVKGEPVFRPGHVLGPACREPGRSEPRSPRRSGQWILPIVHVGLN